MHAKHKLPRQQSDPRYPLQLTPQQKIAFVMSPRLGDALISMVVVHNLKRNGLSITVWSDVIDELKDWFPGVTVYPRPQPQAIRAIFSEFDIILHAFAVDVIDNMQQWHRGVYILEQSTYNWLKITMVDIQVQFCTHLLGLSSVVRNNGIVAPAGLSARCYQQRVIIHPTSTSITRNWLPKRFIQLAQQLIMQQQQPVFIVSAKERPHWLWVEAQGIKLPNFTDLNALASYIYQSGFFIGNDSGIGHLASALGIPTLTLCIRPNLAKRWRPAWAPGIVILPPVWLITRPVKEKFWKYFISVQKVLKNFIQLTSLFLQKEPYVSG